MCRCVLTRRTAARVINMPGTHTAQMELPSGQDMLI